MAGNERGCFSQCLPKVTGDSWNNDAVSMQDGASVRWVSWLDSLSWEQDLNSSWFLIITNSIPLLWRWRDKLGSAEIPEWFLLLQIWVVYKPKHVAVYNFNPKIKNYLQPKSSLIRGRALGKRMFVFSQSSLWVQPLPLPAHVSWVETVGQASFFRPVRLPFMVKDELLLFLTIIAAFRDKQPQVLILEKKKIRVPI